MSWIERLKQELGGRTPEKPPENSFSLEDFAKEGHYSMSHSGRICSDLVKSGKLEKVLVKQGRIKKLYFFFKKK